MSIASSEVLASIAVAHRRGPRLGAEDADRERRLLRVHALLFHLLGDRQHVRRRHHDDVGLEVGNDLHLPLGHAARNRDHRAAELLRAVVRAESAGEQSVAVRHMHDVAGAAARGADRARHDSRPGVDVLRRVADHRRLAGRSARRVQPHHLLARHGEQAERVVVAQVLLQREREPRQVRQRLQVARLHLRGVERRAVVRDVVVRVVERPAQALELQRLQFGAWGALDRLEVGGRWLLDRHHSSLLRAEPPACPSSCASGPASRQPPCRPGS